MFRFFGRFGFGCIVLFCLASVLDVLGAGSAFVSWVVVFVFFFCGVVFVLLLR